MLRPPRWAVSWQPQARPPGRRQPEVPADLRFVSRTPLRIVKDRPYQVHNYLFVDQLRIAPAEMISTLLYADPVTPVACRMPRHSHIRASRSREEIVYVHLSELISLGKSPRSSKLLDHHVPLCSHTNRGISADVGKLVWGLRESTIPNTGGISSLSTWRFLHQGPCFHPGVVLLAHPAVHLRPYFLPIQQANSSKSVVPRKLIIQRDVLFEDEIDAYMNETFVLMRQYLMGIEVLRHKVAWRAIAYHAMFICGWCDRFDVTNVKSLMQEVQAKCVEFGQAHDYLPRRQREAWPAIEQAFSKEEEFGCIETVFSVLAGREATKMGPKMLADHLGVLPDATTAKLIDMMIDRKLISRATIDLVGIGIGRGWIGNGDSDGVRLSKYRARWTEQVQAQEGEQKALQDAYRARWQPVSDFITQRVTEARGYADGAHGLLLHQYGHNLSGANFGTELKPALTAPPSEGRPPRHAPRRFYWSYSGGRNHQWLE
ncbi:hypothetical protein BP00DRAFT_466277 [Aspergillus indologenus CBS 114.80]|uniref:Uncharacterized protein n=1 Tax=Aspergillus indologenus CBS 114.80 TaxID=1450541 RepID=A0A2V5IJU8_9EURO|nr:hypothetical protein BP00DRAFT_466277 [Aspergillus indologenus CBS 114.80]